MDFSGNELKNLQQVGSVKGRFIPANPDLLKSFLSGNGYEILSHLFWRMESANLFGLNKDVPGPAEKASQTAPHTVCSGNPSIKRSRTESIILSLLSGSNSLSYLFSQFDRIIQ
jgi:hypothetical protein